MNKRLWSIIKSLVNVLSQKVSNKTWAKICLSFAPKASFKPISGVLSVTIKNIILATLIPPTAKVRIPQKPKNNLILVKNH